MSQTLPPPSIEPPRPESEINVADYFRVIHDHWRLIALLALLGLGVGGALFVMTPKAYLAKSTISIERRSPIPMQTSGDAFWWESFYSMEFYPTQYRLLQSRGLAERVVQNLRLDQDPKFAPARAALPGSAPEQASAAADEAALSRLAQRLLGGLTIAPVRNTQMVDISYVASSGEMAARIANGVAEAYIDWGIETRSALAGKTSVFLLSQIEALKQEIQDKENQLLAYGRSKDIISLDSGGNVVMSRLTAIINDLNRITSERIGKMARLRALESVTEANAADVLDDSLVSQVRGDLLQLERDYTIKLQTYKPEWPPMMELKAKIEKARQNFGQVASEALSRARESARTEYETVMRQEQALQAELSQLKAENREVSSAAVEYNNLKVEVAVRRAQLDEMLRRQSETDVSSRMQSTRESNVRIVDRAIAPSRPFRPSLRRNLAMGGGVGLFLGVAFVFLLHFLDRTVKTPEQVERELGLSLLAVIPDVAASMGGRGLLARYGLAYGYGYGYGYGGAYGYGYGYYGREKAVRESGRRKKAKKGAPDVTIELLPHLRPRMPVSEAYRSLRTALLLSSAEELKMVVVTSAVPGEGKTATASNLAIVLAQLGKQVLLVDGDLRKARQHEVFKISNRVGLVSYLTGSVEPEKIVFRSELPNLFLTPAGPAPPNPSELLSSERMREFVRLMRARFDIVIFDSAPTLAVTDATLIGSLADGVVLTLGSGYVLRQDARASRDRLQMAEVKILGAVLNRFRLGPGTASKGYSDSDYYGSTPASRPATEVAAL